MRIQSPPPLVLEAIEALRKALHHLLLVIYIPDFREETKKCVAFTHRAIELLLREYAVSELGVKPEELESIKTHKLIQNFDWDNQEENDLLTLNRWRNEHIHGVLEDIENYDRQGIINILQQSLFLAGYLLKTLGYTFNHYLSPFEQQLIEREEPDWQSLSTALARTALYDFADDPDISVDIANIAFKIAFINFAESWRFSVPRELSVENIDDHFVKNLIEFLAREMNNHEDELARYWWWNKSDPAITDTYRDIYSFWFIPPMTPTDRFAAKLKRNMDPEEAARYYAVEVNEMVKSFIDRSPMLDLEEYVRSNWQLLTNELSKRCPGIEIPIVNHEDWPNWHFYNKTISIRLQYGFDFGGWSDVEKKIFIKTVEDFYGKLPIKIQVDFNRGMDYF